jgi:hypothetical protein
MEMKSRDPLSVKQIPLGRSPGKAFPHSILVRAAHLEAAAAGGLISFSAWIH